MRQLRHPPRKMSCVSIPPSLKNRPLLQLAGQADILTSSSPFPVLWREAQASGAASLGRCCFLPYGEGNLGTRNLVVRIWGSADKSIQIKRLTISVVF